MSVGTLNLEGLIGAKRVACPSAPLSWKLENALTGQYIGGLVANVLGKALHRLTGLPVLTSELKLKVHKESGEWLDYGTVSRRLITTAGVGLLVDDWQAGTPRINDMKYVGCGSGTTGAQNTDTALEFECLTYTNPDNTRATGTVTQPSANVCQIVGTITFDGTVAVTEHGILNQAATGGGVLWDRHTFAAINVSSGDSIQFTYQCTVNAET